MIREATPEEYERMTDLQKRWYDENIVPIVLLKDGSISGVPMNTGVTFALAIKDILKKGMNDQDV